MLPDVEFGQGPGARLMTFIRQAPRLAACQQKIQCEATGTPSYMGD